MRSRIIPVTLIGALVVVAGVWLSSVPGPGGAEPAPIPPQTLDDIYAQMARDVPGFAGMRLGPDGETVQVFFEGPSAEARAALEQAVAGFFEARGDSPPDRIDILPATYDFSELKEWYDRLVVLAIPGLVTMDIDEARNRLSIGVETPEVVAQVERRLAELGIPREVVIIEIVEPIVELSSLQDRHRPLRGGLRIIGNFTGAGNCTLGFNGTRAGIEGFVTAHHCSQVIGGVDGTGYYQPTNVSGNLAGVETVDPAFFTVAPCPQGRRCRYSQGSFVSRAGGVSGNRGQIARTNLDSVAWNGSNVYRIVNDFDSPLVGQLVMKTGANTGRTQGFISATCVRADVGGSDRTYFCQHQAGTGGIFGDSGGPVYRITNSPLIHDVKLYGMIWGGSGSTATFSGMGQIERQDELGSIGTCATGFNC